MALHAVENVGPAFTVAREFLTPLDPRRWLKLAVVAFFIGGGMNLPTAQFDVSGVPDGFPDGISEGGVPLAVPADLATIVAAVAVAAVLLALAFALVGAVMEFVFVESLRREEISVRRYWRRRWRQGLRLFGFRIAIGLPFLALFLGWLALFLVPLFTGVTEPIVPFAAFLLGIPLLFVAGIVYGLITGFTTVFVVPIMIVDDSGVLAAWRRLWGSLKVEWNEYLAYAVVGFVLTLAVGLLASIALGFAAIALLVPITLLVGVTHLTVSLSSTVGFAILVALVLLFVVTVIVLWALVQVPILAYLRYYALLVLGDIDAEFDVVPDQRKRLGEA